MLGPNESRVYLREVRFRKTAVSFLISAAVLFLVSFSLQLAASLQRWVMFSGPQGPADISIEDHVYDYFLPSEPWEPIGNAAQLAGTGLLVQALGLLVMALGVMLLPPAATELGRRTRNGFAAIEIVLAIFTASAFAAHGGLLVAAGVKGEASGLAIGPGVAWPMLLGTLVALVALALLWGNRLRAAAAACVFLIGSTLVGYLLATYLVAPIIFGASHDTARFTETVIAASTAAAAVAIAFGTRDAVRRKPTSVEPE